MPFTFSHPAIILPLTYLPRKWFSLTGLVIGSVVPDFENFIKMKSSSYFSHTFKGVFLFDLPLGILMACFFHILVRDSLINNLPLPLKSRLSVFTQFDWVEAFKRTWLVVIISILIGAASHLLWDSFTHASLFGVDSIPALSNTIEIADRQVHLYKILQYVSSIAGGLIVAFALWQLKVDKNVQEQINFKYWGIFVSIVLAIIAINLLIGLNYRSYKQLVITSISAILASLILTPLFVGKSFDQRRHEA